MFYSVPWAQTALSQSVQQVIFPSQPSQMCVIPRFLSWLSSQLTSLDLHPTFPRMNRAHQTVTASITLHAIQGGSMGLGADPGFPACLTAEPLS